MFEKINEWLSYANMTISFKKAMTDISGYGWHTRYKLITDHAILDVVNNLKDKYDFKILYVKLEDNCSNSKIKLRCKKEEKYLILSDFSRELAGYIEDTEMY